MHLRTLIALFILGCLIAVVTLPTQESALLTLRKQRTHSLQLFDESYHLASANITTTISVGPKEYDCKQMKNFLPFCLWKIREIIYFKYWYISEINGHSFIKKYILFKDLLCMVYIYYINIYYMDFMCSVDRINRSYYICFIVI